MYTLYNRFDYILAFINLYNLKLYRFINTFINTFIYTFINLYNLNYIEQPNYICII